MKNSYIIRKLVAGLFVVVVAVCAFGCSDTKNKTAISSKDIEKAFSAAAEKYDVEEVDWETFEETSGISEVSSSITMRDDDASELFYSKVGIVLGIQRDDIPEIKEISVFYLCDSSERIYGHYIIFENEKDCKEYRDLFFDWFGNETSLEKGYECSTQLTDGRMNGAYQDGTTLIWFTEYLNDTPEILPFIYDELELSFPEKSEE
ncbi:MAG: hypothetical protein J6U54_06350 [Clostridiales bacterium]|nr:hypothetical protein [Clostridiales bacterium]